MIRFPAVITRHGGRARAVIDIPVSRAEHLTCLALERCAMPREIIVRVALPMARRLALESRSPR